MNEAAPPPKRSKKAFWIATIFFVLCGIGYWFYWWKWGQYEETTKDAYVNGNLVILSSQIEGRVAKILVDNTERVEAGQPLIEVDRKNYEIALEKAKANLADTVRLVEQMFYTVKQLQAKKRQSEAYLLKARLDYEHRKALIEEEGVSKEEFEHSQSDLLAALANVSEVENRLKAAQAEMEKTTIFSHPKVEEAKARLKKAFLDWKRCRIVAPVRGIITQRKVQLGQWISPQTQLMALVPIDQIWIDANFREVSLRNLRVGQPVEMTSDMYGKEVKFRGEVMGLNPGTGSVFSILPPQNATGNWIKIIQRVPVRIQLHPHELKAHPLILGLSMKVTVDTHSRRGERFSSPKKGKPMDTTLVYQEELQGVEALIDTIIRENLSVPHA